MPRFKEDGKYPEDLLPASDLTMTLTGVTSPLQVTLSASGKDLQYHHSGTTLTIQLPATLRTPLVDVVEVRLGNSAERNNSKTPH